jgi:predicted esterase
MQVPARWLLFLTLLVLLTYTLAPVTVRAEDEEAPAAQPAYQPQPLAPSWRDQATAAYGEKRYADAIFLYRKWLEADPHDDGSWYNLACTYALAGQRAAALEAFETAVDAGWEDPKWPTQDTDLERIRQDSRFEAAIARCVANQGKNAPQDAVRHWVKIPAMTTYLALLPPDYETSEAEYPLVLILHGNGSSEAWHGRIADAVGRDGVIYVAPRAPYPNSQVFYQLRRPGWTWLPQDIDEESTERLDAARLYVDSIFAAVEDARKRYRVAGDKVYVFGHSMGGFFANVAAILHPEEVAATFAYAGGLDEHYHDAKWLEPLKTHGVKMLHVHGTADPVVPPERSREAHRLMEAAGVDSRLRMVEGVDHGVQEPVREILKAWIRDVVLGH